MPPASQATPDRLVIHNPPASAASRCVIETEIDPARNEALMGLYRSSKVYCTQCEAEGFRRITYFLDRPDILSVYTVRIEAERAEAPLLLVQRQSGRAAATSPTAGTTPSGTIRFPKPSYLFALVAGDLGCIEDSFVTAVGPQGRARHLCRARQGAAAPATPWTR